MYNKEKQKFKEDFMKKIFELLMDDYENIQEMVFENCIIPEGTFMEIYVNPDGIYEEDLTSDGFSLFLHVDKEITYYDLLNADIYEGCTVKNDEVRIDLITEEDSFNRLEECTFNKISLYI